MLRLLALAAFVAAALPAAAQNSGALVTNDPSLCLAVTGTTVSTRSCAPSLNVWSARYYSRNAFVIQANGNCLDAYRGENRPVEVVRCDGSLEQDWFLNSTGQIQNKRYNNLCLDVEGGLGNNRRVLAYACDFNSNQGARRANQRFYFGNVRPRQSNDRVVSVPGLAGSGYTATGLQGAGMVAAGGGNMVAAGGGNVVSPGGGNMVAAGGGN